MNTAGRCESRWLLLRRASRSAGRRSGAIWPWLVAVPFVVMLAGGLKWWTGNIAWIASATRVQGVVVEMVRGGKNGYSPVVEYVVDGRRFTHHSHVSSSPPAYSVGEAVTVLHTPGNPADAALDGFVELHLFPMILTIVGGVGTVAFGIVILWYRRSAARKARARAFGTAAFARVVSVDVDTSVRVNNRCGSRLTAVLPRKSGPELRFVSDRIWDGALLARLVPGHEIRVHHVEAEPECFDFDWDSIRPAAAGTGLPGQATTAPGTFVAAPAVEPDDSAPRSTVATGSVFDDPGRPGAATGSLGGGLSGNLTDRPVGDGLGPSLMDQPFDKHPGDRR